MRDRRGSAHSRGYGAAWRRLRKAHLAREPLCRMCKAQGKITAANVVDHIKQHHGNPALLFDAANLQSLCKQHHDSAKQSQERTGVLRGADVNGMPLDPAHPWNSGTSGTSPPLSPCPSKGTDGTGGGGSKV